MSLPVWTCSSSGLGCADQRFDQGMEQDEAVGGIESGFDGALGMGHKADNVAFAVADAGNVVDGAVRIARRVIGAVGCGVAENNLAILFQFSHGRVVAHVVAVVVRD